MSYILDALRKSERERQQGRIPDLGQQVHLIHQPGRRGLSAIVWVFAGLCLNAIVLAVLFWPPLNFLSPLSETGNGKADPAETTSAAAQEGPVAEPDARVDAGEPPPLPQAQTEASAPAGRLVAEPSLGPNDNADQPTVIVPSWKKPAQTYSASPGPSASGEGGRVRNLVELPLSFQRQIPSLTFNSHLYASDPAARRVTINNNYLRPGDQFSGIRVERITLDGVVLSANGQRFRVGVVRNWTSPN